MALALSAAAGFSASPALGADYEREERWAQEVVPSIVVGDAVYLAIPSRPKVLAILTLPQGAPAGGVVIVHGLGVHPDWGLIGGLRTGLADAGYMTLAVQMPVLASGATRDDYKVTMPEAADRIAAAVDYLRRRGSAKIAIVSHSLGASMANQYLARSVVDAWAPIGMFGPFAVPPKEPVLDIVAETEIDPVRETRRRGHRRCRRMRAPVRSRSPAPIITSRVGRRSSSLRLARSWSGPSPSGAERA